MDLELLGVIAFDGITRNGLCLHPDQTNVIYPMGSKIIIKDLVSDEQTFLAGHTNTVTAVSVSPCGTWVASGQMNHHGFKAMVIVWDYAERKTRSSYEIHKVRVDGVCFTVNSEYLISLGGRDDGNVVVWDVRNDEPICGASASNEIAGDAYVIARTNLHEGCFLSAGDRTLRIWRVNPETRRIIATDVKMGKIRRTINCVAVDEKDGNVYCGTTSGDIVKARLNILDGVGTMVGCYSKVPKGRGTSRQQGAITDDLYKGGVRSLLLLENCKIIVGAGDGTVDLVEIIEQVAGNRKATSKSPTLPQILTHRTGNVCSAVTSLVLRRDGHVLAGTVNCEIYEIELSKFRKRLLVTCHTSQIFDLAFPRDRSDIFATAGKNDVRLWSVKGKKEVLRISVPNFVCSSLCFDVDLIVSAWNDGMIRGFALRNGDLVYEIHNGHVKPVSAITITNDSTKLISGGCDGQVKVWDARSTRHSLLQVLKEHRGPITCLCISYDDKDLVSSSTDGTCIIWDAKNFARKFVLMGNTMYMAACLTPDGVQVLTCGTDRKIAYWETIDGALVREIEGSTGGTLNCIDVDRTGKRFLTGSNDCNVKLWDYLEGCVVGFGTSHAAPITAVRFAPDGKCFATASADGTIMVWASP